MNVGAAVETLADRLPVLVFTGAGMSTESGIPDFRGPDGLWTKVDPDDFTISRYLAKPELRVQKWRMHADGELWGARSTVGPNRGHEAIVGLERGGILSGVVTQNIDGLHLVSGLDETRVAELHGNVRRVVCVGCAQEWDMGEVLTRVDSGEDDPACSHCGGILKSSTIMFGEALPSVEWDKAIAFSEKAGSVLVVGSTMSVYPAGDIPLSMVRSGKPMVIVNQGPTEADHLADVRLEAPAGEILPMLTRQLLAV